MSGVSSGGQSRVSTIRILGIGPGLRGDRFRRHREHGSRLVYVASGCIKSKDKRRPPERIKTLFAGLGEVIATYGPDHAAVEKVFVNVNPQSTLLLSQAGGRPSALVTPACRWPNTRRCRSSRRWSAGQGGQSRCSTWWSAPYLPGAPTADAADALACAICHAHGGLGLGRWAVGQSGRLSRPRRAPYRVA